jgi:hypothetical protein
MLPVCYITADIFRESDLLGGNWYATHIHFLSPLPGTCINLFRFRRDLQIIKYSYCEVKGKGKVYSCTGTEALYRAYGPLGE